MLWGNKRDLKDNATRLAKNQNQMRFSIDSCYSEAKNLETKNFEFSGTNIEKSLTMTKQKEKCELIQEVNEEEK